MMSAAINVMNNKPLKVSIPKEMRVPSLKSKKYVDTYQYNEFFNEIPQRPTRPRSITPPVIFEQLTPEFVPNPNYKRTPPVIRYPKLFDPMSPPYSYHNIPANDPKKIKKTTPNLEAKKRNMMLLSPIIENILAEIPDDTVSAKSPEVSKAAKKMNILNRTPEIRSNAELMGMLDELALSYVALLKLSYIETRKGKLTKKQMAIRDELRRERDNLRKQIKRRFNRYNLKNVEAF